MKTISGHCASVKDVSLSKAAKILSKFVSAENGASHIISAYLHRASASFSELNQIHKELDPSHSHKKHKKHRTETGTDSGRVVENSVRSVNINQELSLEHVKSIESRRQQTGNENADLDDDKSNQTIVKSNQELNGSVGYETENVGGSEMLKKKKKKKKLEVESLQNGDSTVKFGEGIDDSKLPNGTQIEIESGREQGNEGDFKPEMEEGRKQKSAKKKHKASYEDEVENEKGIEQQKEIEKKLSNGIDGENGGLGGSQDSQIKKKKKYEKGKVNTLYAEEEGNLEQSKNGKSDDVEEKPEHPSGGLTKKKMKRKHSGDITT
ncbi:general transcriptional corepressor trfA-like [Vigna unguiculata]|uniref:general transcriptional corepressor trfA-like n=1 Tax=Vigna unguiculata TaxID=3917 RepID=UPI0010170A16|nr:general transcriptional corepressor trfA-like [Vigna unguiculata]XP_027938593.1 general transcriptional corepressor trfA-like [Vigna unguiculata]